MRLRQFELIPSLVVAAAVLLLASLGMWQMQRLEWKTQLITNIEQSQIEPALKNLPPDLTGLDYHKVELRGRFLKDISFRRISGRKEPGREFFMLLPFKPENDKRVILVNVGLAPADKKPDARVQTVKGFLRPAFPHRLFVPENRPDQNIWLYENIPAMSRLAKVELLPLVLEAFTPYNTDTRPITPDGKILLRNDHLGYALTWFSLALVGIVMLIFYHRLPDNKKA